MDTTHYYTTKVEWKEGRIGELTEPTFPKITVATPPEFTGGESGIWSPEHLFVSSASICLMTTFLAIAENSKFNFKSFECEGIGKLEKVDGKFMISEIELKPSVVINEEKDKDKALRLIEKSEKACLISNSMKSKIILNPNISVSNN